MDERQKLLDEMKCYREMRDLATDEAAIEAIETMIKETEERLAEVENGSPDRSY